MVVIVVMVVMVVVVLFDIVVWWYGGNGDGGDGSNRSLFNHLPPWAPCHAAQCRERFPKLGQQRLWRRWL